MNEEAGERLLLKMKEAGIKAALIRKDGVLLSSTFALPELAPELIAVSSNISESLFRLEKESQQEVEISFNDGTYIIIPLEKVLLCCVARSKEEKKRILNLLSGSG